MNWIALAAIEELETNQAVAIARGTDHYCVVLLPGGTVAVFDDRCSHANCRLSGGVVRDGTLECPCHGAIFTLDSGTPIDGPARSPITKHDVRVEGRRVFVAAGTPVRNT